MSEISHSEPSKWRIRLATAVRFTARLFESSARLVRLVAGGITVGLLGQSEIKKVVFDSYAKAPDYYHPEKYKIRYEEEFLDTLESHVGGSRTMPPRLLDLYCGHGREAEIFSNTGYSVTAVDLLPEVIDRARRYAADNGFEADFVVANIDSWEPPSRDWDVVYTSLWMYSTVPDRAARIDWVRRLASWAQPNGVFVLSVRIRSGGRGEALRYAVARAISAITFSDRSPELGDRFDGSLFWHDFASDEAEQELATAGLRVVDRFDVGGGAPCAFLMVRPSAVGLALD